MHYTFGASKCYDVWRPVQQINGMMMMVVMMMMICQHLHRADGNCSQPLMTLSLYMMSRIMHN